MKRTTLILTLLITLNLACGLSSLTGSDIIPAAVEHSSVGAHTGSWGYLIEAGPGEGVLFALKGYVEKGEDVRFSAWVRSPQGNITLTHDPGAEIVNIPGWGQAITRHPERAAEHINPMLSQFISYADPERVNSFDIVLHVGHFYSRNGDRDYIAYNEQSGKISYSDEFLTHLQYWDDMLDDVVDPLVEAGYLQWTSIPEIGELYQEWGSTCRE